MTLSRDDIDLLPPMLRELSFSKHEVVLPYEQALQAIDIFVTARWGLLGWEAWVKRLSGHHGHHQHYQGTVGLEQRPTETWDEFVRWSANFCRQTMYQDQQRFNADPMCKDEKLFFCLTARDACLTKHEVLCLDSTLLALTI